MSDTELYKIGGIDLCNMFLVESRSGYDIMINDDNKNKIILANSKLNIPFGMEKYNNKNIINFEFKNYESDDETNILFKKIQRIDNFFCRLSIDESIRKKVNITDSVKELLKNRMYTPCIKKRSDKFDPLVRVHIRTKGSAVLTDFNEPADNIKNKFSVNEIEVGTLWMTQKNYGIILFLNKCNTILN